MWLSDISIKRPVFATVINLLVILIGIIAFNRLPLREYPDIDAPVVSINTAYLGAAAETVESRVTKVIEDTVSGIQGVRSIESESQDGNSSIVITFVIGRNIDDAANDVRDRISRVTSDLPEEIESPRIAKQDADTDQTIWLALQSQNRNALELTDYADRFIRDRLSNLDGVANVIIGGERRYAMRIWLDRKEMAARGITAPDVERALLRENVELPAGRIEALNQELSVRIARQYNNAADFSKLVIKRGDDGYLVRLSDVAKVEVGPEDERTNLNYNRVSGVGLGISKQSTANTLTVARGVITEMEKIRETLPKDMTISVAYDASLFIEASIHEVYFTLGLTIILVIFVIWLFLGDWRATLIPAVTIPISAMGAFIVLQTLGYSVNLLTLLAIVLAIGLVVDDAIVVLENIYRRIEEGEQKLSASYKGANQVAFAVIATTLVLAAVFIPISFMPGNIGRLFTEFAWAIVGAVLFSSFVALTASPMMCSKLLSTKSAQAEKNFLSRWLNNAIAKFEVPYRSSLGSCIRHPFFVILTIAVLSGLGYFFFKFVPSEYAPTEDRGIVFVVMIAPEGSSLEFSKRHMLMVEERMAKLLPPDHGGPKDGTGEAHGIVNIVPGGFSSTGAVNSGIAIALLKEWGARRYSGEIVKQLFGDFSQIPGVLAFPLMPPSLGQNPRNTPVQFVIGGDDYKKLAEWRDKILERVQKNPRMFQVDYDYKEVKPQLKIEIARDRAADLGVSVSEIGSTLQTMFGSKKVTTYLDRGEEYEVVLQGKYEDRISPTDLDNVYVKSERTNELIPLSNLVTMRTIGDSGSLPRYNRLRSVTITANLVPGYSLGEALKFMEQTAAEVAPDARIDYKGESREFRETGNAIFFTFLLALLAVYLFLAAQFESFVHPVVIMMTVPFALIGALWGLYAAGATLNVYTQVGLIMLVGLAAKNGILIVEFANQLRDEGVEFMEAIMEASQKRLRPILMTSIATVAGAMPLVFATGAGMESRFPIGVVIVAGVSFSTLLTLFVVPTFYVLLGRNTRSPLAVTRALEAELQEKV